MQPALSSFIFKGTKWRNNSYIPWDTHLASTHFMQRNILLVVRQVQDGQVGILRNVFYAESLIEKIISGHRTLHREKAYMTHIHQYFIPICILFIYDLWIAVDTYDLEGFVVLLLPFSSAIIAKWWILLFLNCSMRIWGSSCCIASESNSCATTLSASALPSKVRSINPLQPEWKL